MNKYEISVITKYYKLVTVEAESDEEARDKVWDMVIQGFDGVTDAEDADTELFIKTVEEGGA